MKKIFLMNIVFFTMILGVSYIPVEGGSSEHLLQGFGVVISFLTILWLIMGGLGYWAGITTLQSLNGFYNQDITCHQ